MHVFIFNIEKIRDSDLKVYPTAIKKDNYTSFACNNSNIPRLKLTLVMQTNIRQFE